MPNGDGKSWLFTFLLAIVGICLTALGTLNLFIVKEFKFDLTAKIDRVVALYRDEQSVTRQNINKLADKIDLICRDVVKHETILNNGNNKK